jgi:hypothetical protein
MRLSPLHGSSINRYVSCLVSLSSGLACFPLSREGDLSAMHCAFMLIASQCGLVVVAGSCVQE